jgi:hypothetical protein
LYAVVSTLIAKEKPFITAKSKECVNNVPCSILGAGVLKYQRKQISFSQRVLFEKRW